MHGNRSFSEGHPKRTSCEHLGARSIMLDFWNVSRDRRNRANIPHPYEGLFSTHREPDRSQAGDVDARVA